MNKPGSIRSDAHEQTTRAAWLYFVTGNTQEQTAELLGISRVNLMGSWRTERRPRLSRSRSNIALHEWPRSKRRFGVATNFLLWGGAAAFVFFRPPPERDALPGELESESPIAHQAVGIVAADLLPERLPADESSVVGVGFGRTIANVPSYLGEMFNPQVKFVSAMGSLTRSSAANPFEVVCRLAERTGGEGHLSVPLIANTIADKQIFMSQRVFKETLALAEQADFLSGYPRTV